MLVTAVAEAERENFWKAFIREGRRNVFVSLV